MKNKSAGFKEVVITWSLIAAFCGFMSFMWLCVVISVVQQEFHPSTLMAFAAFFLSFAFLVLAILSLIEIWKRRKEPDADFSGIQQDVVDRIGYQWLLIPLFGMFALAGVTISLQLLYYPEDGHPASGIIEGLLAVLFSGVGIVGVAWAVWFFIVKKLIDQEFEAKGLFSVFTAIWFLLSGQFAKPKLKLKTVREYGNEFWELNWRLPARHGCTDITVYLLDISDDEESVPVKKDSFHLGNDNRTRTGRWRFSLPIESPNPENYMIEFMAGDSSDWKWTVYLQFYDQCKEVYV